MKYLMLSLLITLSAAGTAWATSTEIENALTANEIPVGSEITFTKEIAVPANASSMEFKIESNNSNQTVSNTSCIYHFTSAPKTRIIRKGTTFKVERTAEEYDYGYHGYLWFAQDRGTLSCSCVIHSDHTNVGKIRQALATQGVTLKFSEPLNF